jgi:hypothetical protein
VVGGVVVLRWLAVDVVPMSCGCMWVVVCACWCVVVGVVWFVEVVLVVVDVVSGVCWDVIGGVAVGSIVVGGRWGIGGAVWGVCSIVAVIVDVVGFGGVVGGVLLRLLLPSKFLNLFTPSFYLAKSGFHLLTLGPVG